MQGFFSICKSINMIHHINKLKDKKHMIIWCRKILWQHSASIYDKNVSKNGHTRNLPQHSKGHIWKTHSKHNSQWWKTKSFPSKIRNKTRCPLLPLLFNIVLEVLLLLSHFSHVRLCETPLMAAYQASPNLGFSWQECWSGLPFLSPMHESEKWKWSCSVVSDLQRPHGLQPSRLLHPWNFPGKSTGVGCHCLLCLEVLAISIR